MSGSTMLADRFEAALARFSDRERMLLGVMMLVFATLAVLGVTFVVRGRLADLHEGIEARRDALQLLATQADEYRRNSAYNDALREQLANNQIRLSTFIEGRAGRANIPRPREFRDAQQVLEGGITMYTTTADFGGIEFEQMQRLLQSIEEADELVFTRQVAVAPARRGGNGIDLEVTLATYKQEQDEEASP